MSTSGPATPVHPDEPTPHTPAAPDSSGAPDARATDEELPEFYRPLAHDRPLVVAQLGQSLDGFIASRTGDAEFVTGPEDRRHLHVLRSLVDAVVVGAATAITDDCRLTVRDAPLRGAPPARVVVDPRGLLPLTARLLTEADAPTWWLVAEDAADRVPRDALAAHVDLVTLPEEQLRDPAAMLDVLAARGARRVLVEGGGRLVSACLAAGVLDRLYVTTAPVLIGDGVPGLRFAGHDVLAKAIRPPARRLVLGEDVCTELDLRG